MKAVIVHGTLGNPQGNWFPWLMSALIEKGWDVSAPSFPTPENQTIEHWQEALEAQVSEYKDVDVFIGHSLGATFILKALENALINPSKVILVSGLIGEINNAEYDALNKDFIDKEFDWAAIYQNAHEVVIFHGDDDPYVPLKQAEIIAMKLKTALYTIQNGGHLNAESGYIEFPEILEYLDV